jgi:hypothetical protein
MLVIAGVVALALLVTDLRELPPLGKRAGSRKI